MSANPKDFLQPTSTLSHEAIRPFPASRKIYQQGSRPDLQVGMREVTQTPTPSSHGAEENPPITVYDTSGPYTDPTAHIDLRAGLAALREPWILERNDTVQLDGPSSEYGRARARDPKLAHLRFEHIRKPRRAKSGRERVADALRAQRHDHARDGIHRHPGIHPSRRIPQGPALRQAPEAASRQCLRCRHPRDKSRPSSCATKSRAGAPSSPTTSTTRNPSR